MYLREQLQNTINTALKIEHNIYFIAVFIVFHCSCNQSFNQLITSIRTVISLVVDAANVDHVSGMCGSCLVADSTGSSLAKNKTVTFLHTRYQALGPKLIPVCWQSARGDFSSHPPAVGCHYFPPGLGSPSQQKNVTVLRPVPSYTVW